MIGLGAACLITAFVVAIYALGAACLFLALVVAVYGVIAALCGTRGDRRFTDSSRRAVYAFGALR